MADPRNPMTVGVEEEFFVVDAETGALAAQSEVLLEEIRDLLAKRV